MLEVSKYEMLSVLSSDVKVKMFEMLVDVDEVCVCEFEEELCISQPNASKHFKSFKDLGIVEVRKEGKKLFYSLKPEVKQKHKKLIEYLKES